jgi:hypothetical protein
VYAIKKSIPYVPQTTASTRKNHIAKSAKDCGIRDLKTLCSAKPSEKVVTLVAK